MENSGLSSSRKTVEAIHPWKKAWQTLKAIWPQLVYISLVCMSIPQYLLFYFSSNKAFELGQAFQVKQPISFENALVVLQKFGFHYVSVGWVVLVLFLVGCFTAIALSLQVSSGQHINLQQAFRSGVKALFPKGLAFLFACLLFVLLLLNITIQMLPAQLIRFFGMIIAVLLSALPTLMLLDRSRPFAALKRALSLDYVSFTGMSKWSAFFLLLTFQLLALNFIALFDWANAYLLEIDVHMHISRDLLFARSAAFPFGKMIWVSEVISTFVFSFLALTFIVLNSTLVYELWRRNSLGRTISVEV